jgi:hypothetical protein
VHFQVFIMFFTTCIPTIYTISSGNISWVFFS